MNCIAKSLVVGAALVGLAGCATYDYAYTEPYHYGYGPYTYYDYGPYAYYGPGYYVVPPAIGFSYRYYGGDHGGYAYRGDRWHRSGWSGRAYERPRNAVAANTHPRASQPPRNAARARQARPYASARLNARDSSLSPQEAARREQHG